MTFAAGALNTEIFEMFHIFSCLNSEIMDVLADRLYSSLVCKTEC